MPGSTPTAFQNLVIWIIIPVLATANQLVQKTMAINLPHGIWNLDWLLQISYNPWLLAVLFLEITTFILWIGVLSHVNLSRATPITAISYMLITVISWFWFGEKVQLTQVMGIVAIIAGLQLLHRTDHAE